jgi:ferric enterobactin receptor
LNTYTPLLNCKVFNRNIQACLSIKLRLLFIWILISVFSFLFSALSAQQTTSVLQFKIHKNEALSNAIRRLNEKWNLLIAFESSVTDMVSEAEVELRAYTTDELIHKICCIYKLDCKKSADKEYLFRYHIHLKDERKILINVFDGHTKSPVEDVSVWDEKSNIYYFTDTFGDVVVSVNPNERKAAFKLKKLDFVENELQINPEAGFYAIRIESSPVQISEVKVQSFRPSIVTSGPQQSFRSNIGGLDAMSVSSVFGRDVLRTAQLYSGVNAINDASASLKIRGGATEATLLLLDGMPIYKADHFYGILSAVNGYFISDYSLYKNNIPVQYGGKTSGLLDISSGKIPEKAGAVADINSLYSSVKADIPIGSDAGISVAGRITYMDLAASNLNNLATRQNIPTEIRPVSNLITVRPDFDFYDLNAKMYLNTGNHRFFISGFRSRDTFTDSRRLNFRTPLFDANEEVFRQTNMWANNAATLQHAYSGTKHSFQTRIWYSGYDNSNLIGGLFRNQRNNVITVDTISLNNKNSIADLGASFTFSNTKSGFMIGGEAIAHTNEVFLENGSRTILEINNTGSQFSLFAEQKVMSENEKSVFIPALRISWLPAFQTAYLLPQLNYSYRAESGLSFKSAVGRHMQYIRLLEHENNLGQSQQFFALSNQGSIPVGLSRNTMVGINFVKNDLRFDLEIYYKKLDGSVTHATVAPGLRPPQQPAGFADYKIFSGEGRSYGTDFSVIFEKKAYFGMISYSLSKAENKFTEIFRNQYFPSSEDSRHQLKLVNTLRLGKWDFSANYITASGRPYIDLSSLTNTVDRSRIVITDYIKNLDAYHRLDAGLAFNFKWAGIKSKAGISIFNLTNHRNARYRQFVYRLPGINNVPNNTVLGSEVIQLERTFNFNFTISI